MSTYFFFSFFFFFFLRLRWQNKKRLLQGVLVGLTLGLSNEKHMEKGCIVSIVG